MTDLYMRDAAPLTTEEWERIDKVVIDIARRTLVGRRFISLYGPVGAGQIAVPAYRFKGAGPLARNEPIVVSDREYTPFPEIYKDFVLNWREIAIGRQLPGGLDLAPAAIASNLCSLAEDEAIFQHLLKFRGRTVVKAGDWDVDGNGFADVSTGIERFTEAGILPPYALVTSPALYAKLHRVYKNSGVL
jgi:uncharacterized linocin/CFP29 family protein